MLAWSVAMLLQTMTERIVPGVGLGTNHASICGILSVSEYSAVIIASG